MPEKEALEAEQNLSKEIKQNKVQKDKRKIAVPEDESDNEEYFCLLCTESYECSELGEN